MKTLRESILSDMDNVINDGDYHIHIYKKAEKDWNKLIDMNCDVRKYTSNIWVFNIKSKELATYLLGNLKAKNEPDSVRLFINILDALETNIHKMKRVTIHLVKNNNAEVITTIPYHLPWNEHNDFNLVTDKATTHEMIYVTLNNIKEYLQFDNINVVKELIKQNSII